MKKYTLKEIFRTLFISALITIVLFAFIFSSSNFPNVNGADDYVLTSGSFGGITWNSNLTELKAGHNYYFTFRTTESITINGIFVSVFNYGNPPQPYDYNYTENGVLYMVAHIDFSIYEGSGSADISSANVLVKTWAQRYEIINGTDMVWLVNPDDYGGGITKSNAFIAIAFTPSIDIFANASTTANFIGYEENSNNDVILSLRPSLQGQVGFYIIWRLTKGAVSSDIAYPVAVSIFRPKTIIQSFATESGFSFDSVGIAAFSFVLLAVTILLYKKDVEVSAIIFGIITLGLSAIFGLLQIIPFWFALPVGMISLSLLTFESAIKFSQGFER